MKIKAFTNTSVHYFTAVNLNHINVGESKTKSNKQTNKQTKKDSSKGK